MATYVHLVKGTPEGFKNIKGLGGRWANLKKNIEAAGGKVLGAYALMGEYDYLIIAEMPSNDAALSVILKAASKGTASYQTLPAVAIDKFVKLVDKL